MSDAPSKSPPSAIVLLGQQRFDRVLGAQVRGLEVEGRIAMITAGWQEREGEDGELSEHLGTETVNLRLHRRSEMIFAQDPELRELHRVRQQTLRHKQDFYRIRLEHELSANHVIRQRQAPRQVLEEEEGASINAIRALDAYHLEQLDRVHARYEQDGALAERPTVAHHREEVRALLADCSAIAIAGGHVASLLNRLYMFDIKSCLDGHVLFAWSGGAMTLTNRIVLFHDNPPQGQGASELLGRGLSLVNNVVVFPQPELRLRLDDKERVSVLARRFAPAKCLAFPKGAHVTVRDGTTLEKPTNLIALGEAGDIGPFGAAGDEVAS